MPPRLLLLLLCLCLLGAGGAPAGAQTSTAGSSSPPPAADTVRLRWDTTSVVRVRRVPIALRFRVPGDRGRAAVELQVRRLGLRRTTRTALGHRRRGSTHRVRWPSQPKPGRYAIRVRRAPTARPSTPSPPPAVTPSAPSAPVTPVTETAPEPALAAPMPAGDASPAPGGDAPPPVPRSSLGALDVTLGVNPYLLDDARLGQALDRARAAGVTTIASGAVWWHIEQDDGSYDWSGLDRLLAAAKARGLHVGLQVSGTPDRLQPPELELTVPNHGDRIWYPPRTEAQLEAWGAFVAALVTRYRTDVDRYELWNEPNIPEFWKPEPNPAEYARLLRTGFLSAKSVDPEVQIGFGGLSRNDVGYLESFYAAARFEFPEAAGHRHFFDILGVHPYSDDRSPDVDSPARVIDGPFGRVDNNFLGMEHMKEAMDVHGDTGKPIHLGEYGFSTTETWMKAVPDERRGLFLKRAFTLAAGLPYVRGMSWYRYLPSEPADEAWSLLRGDLSPTLTWRALEEVTGTRSPALAVDVDLGSAALAGDVEVRPALTGATDQLTRTELWVDGVLVASATEPALHWHTTDVADGAHGVVVAAFTGDGGVSVSAAETVTVDNPG